MKKINIFLVALCLASSFSYSQKGKVAQADKNYDKMAYIDAIKTYERVFEKGYKTPDMLQKLGNAYYFNADLEKANKWYSELFALTSNPDPEYFYRYAQTLKAVKDYSKADQMMALFNEKNGNDLRSKLAMSQKDYLSVIKKNSGKYTIENAGINSSKSDFGSAFFNNKVVFASSRDTAMASSRASWTNESYTNLYAADMGAEGKLSTPEKFGEKLNSKFHESTPIFTKDGKKVYFTRNNFLNGKKGRDNKRTILLKLYVADLEGDQWVNIKELPFNSDEYSVAHPALSPDEKILYFASDMTGSLGQADIFKVDILSDGTYGTPKNLGNKINTEGRESFPFISAENELFFASDGHPGLGGLDVFVAKQEKDGSYKEVFNVAEPLNSSFDDFALLLNSADKTGYISSNRNGGEGSDDIYWFKQTKKLEYKCDQVLSGIISDQSSNLPIAMAKVTLSDQDHKIIKETVADNNGYYSFGAVDCNSKYYVKAEKLDYNATENAIVIPNESGKSDLPVLLDKSVYTLKVGDDLAKAFGIKIIYFDLDKSVIRQDAAVELSKILDVLKEYPTMEIDIRSHTDSRQSFQYNESLSDRRAKATLGWLNKNGVIKSRMTAKGYGETKLVNRCADGVPCSEQEHQENRRSEFIITKI